MGSQTRFCGSASKPTFVLQRSSSQDMRTSQITTISTGNRRFFLHSAHEHSNCLVHVNALLLLTQRWCRSRLDVPISFSLVECHLTAAHTVATDLLERPEPARFPSFDFVPLDRR